MDQQTWIIVSVIGGILTTALGWALKTLYSSDNEKIKANENKLIGMELEIKKIKENYLDRFEKMNLNVTKSKEEIIEKLHTMQLNSNAQVAAQLIETTAKAVALALTKDK